jgi:hypothetical protein
MQDACTACSRAVELISIPLLKRLGENSRRLVDEPLSGLPHVLPAKRGLRRRRRNRRSRDHASPDEASAGTPTWSALFYFLAIRMLFYARLEKRGTRAAAKLFAGFVWWAKHPDPKKILAAI